MIDSIAICRVFFLIVSNLMFIQSDEIFYGNNITERASSGSDASITPVGARVWVDNNDHTVHPTDAIPGWGFLKSYRVYLHSTSNVAQPLHLQVWTTNTTNVNYYKLKWQKALNNYQTGRAYEVLADLDSNGYPLEITSNDRIGFTSNDTYNPVAMDPETDTTNDRNTAHRTYFRLLSQLNYLIPSVGDIVLVDNHAVRGRYSIGIVVDTDPPVQSNQVYCGSDLKPRDLPYPFDTNTAVVIPSVSLVPGRIDAFYFRLAPQTSDISAQLLVWSRASTNSYNFTLVYLKDVTIPRGDGLPYSKVSLTDGPLVESTNIIGFKLPQNTVYYSSGVPSATVYLLQYDPTPLQTGQTKKFDSFAWPSEYSFGVVINQSVEVPTTPLPTPSAATKPSTTRTVVSSSTTTTVTTTTTTTTTTTITVTNTTTTSDTVHSRSTGNMASSNTTASSFKSGAGTLSSDPLIFYFSNLASSSSSSSSSSASSSSSSSTTSRATSSTSSSAPSSASSSTTSKASTSVISSASSSATTAKTASSTTTSSAKPSVASSATSGSAASGLTAAHLSSPTSTSTGFYSKSFADGSSGKTTLATRNLNGVGDNPGLDIPNSSTTTVADRNMTKISTANVSSKSAVVSGLLVCLCVVLFKLHIST